MKDVYDLKCLIEECQEALKRASNKADEIYSDTVQYDVTYDEQGYPYKEIKDDGWKEMKDLTVDLSCLEMLFKSLIKPMEKTFKSAEEDYKNQPDYDSEY